MDKTIEKKLRAVLAEHDGWAQGDAAWLSNKWGTILAEADIETGCSHLYEIAIGRNGGDDPIESIEETINCTIAAPCSLCIADMEDDLDLDGDFEDDEDEDEFDFTDDADAFEDEDYDEDDEDLDDSDLEDDDL